MFECLCFTSSTFSFHFISFICVVVWLHSQCFHSFRQHCWISHFHGSSLLIYLTDRSCARHFFCYRRYRLRFWEANYSFTFLYSHTDTPTHTSEFYLVLSFFLFNFFLSHWRDFFAFYSLEPSVRRAGWRGKSVKVSSFGHIIQRLWSYFSSSWFHCSCCYFRSPIWCICTVSVCSFVCIFYFIFFFLVFVFYWIIFIDVDKEDVDHDEKKKLRCRSF